MASSGSKVLPGQGLAAAVSWRQMRPASDFANAETHNSIEELAQEHTFRKIAT